MIWRHASKNCSGFPNFCLGTTKFSIPTPMSKAIRITIAGKDLTLRGDNEEKIKQSVREVNVQFQHLQQTLREQSTPTLTVLAALNVAERFVEAREQRQQDVRYVSEELESMARYLERAAQQPLL
ncbi:MAG: cell division protein ZapA [Candidatus Kapabacteria bacterium]|nr:cell division protein ZapA [Candidatus Kapabacteria bacterium]